MALGRETPLPEDFGCSGPPNEWLTDFCLMFQANEIPTEPEPSVRKFINDLPSGTGIGVDADIWPVYNEYTEKADKEMVDTYNEGMDNLLIFAALFSAVVTAFIVLSLPLLSTDPAEVGVEVLLAISAQLMALGAKDITAMPEYTPDTSSPSSSVVMVNVLWTLSLFISLSTSVLAMLVKQWVRFYGTNTPTTAKEKALERQFRYEGLQKWKVAAIANALPIFIHLAVALFYVGLVLYLWLQTSYLWIPFVILVALGAVAYMALAAAPLIWDECPYKSPVTSWLTIFGPALKVFLKIGSGWLLKSPSFGTFNSTSERQVPLQGENIHLAARALKWLSQSAQDPRVVKVLLLARFSWRAEILPEETYERWVQETEDIYTTLPNIAQFLRPLESRNVGKLQWSTFKALLQDQLVACSALQWSPALLGESEDLSWAWSYPRHEVPLEDAFWYDAAVLTIAERLEITSFLPKSARWLWDAFYQSGMAMVSDSISLFASILAVTCRIHRPKDKSLPVIDRSTICPDVIDFVAKSKSLPPELLWAFRVLGEELVTQSVASAEGRRLSAMDDFFCPLFEGLHSEVGQAAMQLALNGLRGRLFSSIQPARCIQSLLQWFETKGYLNLDVSLSSVDYERRLEGELRLEMTLFRECMNAPSELHPILPRKTLMQVVQMMDPDKTLTTRLDFYLSKSIDTSYGWLWKVEQSNEDASLLRHYLSKPVSDQKPVFGIVSLLLVNHMQALTLSKTPADGGSIFNVWTEVLDAWGRRLCSSNRLQEMVFEHTWDRVLEKGRDTATPRVGNDFPLMRLLELCVDHGSTDVLALLDDSGVLPWSQLWKEKRNMMCRGGHNPFLFFHPHGARLLEMRLAYEQRLVRELQALWGQKESAVSTGDSYSALQLRPRAMLHGITEWLRRPRVAVSISQRRLRGRNSVESGARCPDLEEGQALNKKASIAHGIATGNSTSIPGEDGKNSASEERVASPARAPGLSCDPVDLERLDEVLVTSSVVCFPVVLSREDDGVDTILADRRDGQGVRPGHSRPELRIDIGAIEEAGEGIGVNVPVPATYCPLCSRVIPWMNSDYILRPTEEDLHPADPHGAASTERSLECSR